MLQLRETRIVHTHPHDVLTGTIIPEEGLALVYVKEGSETKVQLSTGAANEQFAGVSYARNVPPAYLPSVLTGVVAADNTFELPRNPVAGQVLVKIGGVVCTVVAGTPAAANEVKIGNLEIITNSSAGMPITVQMMYAPTVIEARSIIGDAPIGGLPSSAQGSIGVIKYAVIGTNSYDASADWDNALHVKTAANGTFTVGSLAVHIPNVIVKSAPNAANPFLVLSLNVA